MNSHNFTPGAVINPTAIRNRTTPLTLEQMRSAAPSIFAEAPYKDVSARYAFVSTINIVEGMMKAGFEPFAASQSRTRVEGKQDFTKHLVRFRPHVDAIARLGQHVGDVFPEVVLINSHDRTSAYKLMAGFFRLVCSNGLVVADSLLGSINIKHSGNVIEDVARGTVEIVENLPKALDTVNDWKQIQLTAGEQHAFAEAAHTIRFADNEGHIKTKVEPDALLSVRRWEDKGTDLWSTFNRVQENVMKGGLRGRTHERATRGVKGIDQDVKLNKALWTLGERMAELHAR